MKTHSRSTKVSRTVLNSVAVAGALLCSTAQAQTLSLAPAQPTAAGQTVTFYGAITNPAAGASVYITGGDVFGLSSGLTGDVTTSDLFNDAYFQLAPGATYSPTYTKSFFTVTIAPGLAPGNYTGLFNLDGGATASSTDVLGTQQFVVTVVAPEPSQAATLGLGLLGLGSLIVVAQKRRVS